MPKILYKYLPPGRASVLLDGFIRFSQTAALNDPFESTASVATAALVEQLTQEADDELDKIVRDWPEQPLSEENKELVRLERYRLHQQIKTRLTPNRFGRQIMAMASHQIGVLSLSRTQSSVLMWSHYAQDHTGFVIGLDDENPFFSENDGTGEPTHVHEVLYSSKRIPVDPGTPNVYRKLMCQKAAAWEYEEETRVFRVLQPDKVMGKDAKGLPVYLFQFPKDAIRVVIFGANSSPALRAQLQRYMELNGIRADVFQARLSPFDFDLVFDRLNPPFFPEGAGWNTVSYVFVGCDAVSPFDLEDNIFGRELYHSIYRYPSPNTTAFTGIANADIPNYMVK